MINMLVVDDNFDFAKILVNAISQQNQNIRLGYIATNGKEALDILNNTSNDIDLILLDLDLPYYNGIEILNILINNNIDKYRNSIIIVSGKNELLRLIQSDINIYVYAYIPKSNRIDYLLKTVNDLVKEKECEYFEKDLKSIINNELKYLNYNMSHKGTKYLRDAIFYVDRYMNFEYTNLKKQVYPIIAKKYKTTVNNIKCNITNATQIMNVECSSEKCIKYFGIQNEIYNITPKLVMETILTKLEKQAFNN